MGHPGLLIAPKAQRGTALARRPPCAHPPQRSGGPELLWGRIGVFPGGISPQVPSPNHQKGQPNIVSFPSHIFKYSGEEITLPTPSPPPLQVHTKHP